MLEGEGEKWKKLSGKLPTNSAGHAGVVVGDYLLCFGGMGDWVSGGATIALGAMGKVEAFGLGFWGVVFGLRL